MASVASFSEAATIDSPSSAVWTIIADYRRDPEWRTGVVSMATDPGGPLAEGMVTREVIRVAGRTYRTVGLVDRVEKGSSLHWHTTTGAEARGSRAVRSVGPDRCEVTLELHVVPRGVNRLLSPVLRRMLARNLRRDLVALASVSSASVPVA